MGVRAGSKRSLNLSMDYADGKQRLLGSKTLNLLNGHDDGSFLDAVLYSRIAREHFPAPKANLVKVTVFLADRKYRDGMRDARNAYLDGHPVAFTCVITDIIDEQWFLEVEAYAAR